MEYTILQLVLVAATLFLMWRVFADWRKNLREIQALQRAAAQRGWTYIDRPDQRIAFGMEGLYEGDTATISDDLRWKLHMHPGLRNSTIMNPTMVYWWTQDVRLPWGDVVVAPRPLAVRPLLDGARPLRRSAGMDIVAVGGVGVLNFGRMEADDMNMQLKEVSAGSEVFQQHFLIYANDKDTAQHVLTTRMQELLMGYYKTPLTQVPVVTFSPKGVSVLLYQSAWQISVIDKLTAMGITISELRRQDALRPEQGGH
jgi:hypothetical protein